MPFKFDGRDYDLFPTEEEFMSLEKTGKLEAALTNFKTGEEIGAKIFFSIVPNRNPEGVELIKDYSIKIPPESVIVKVNESALSFMKIGSQVITTYGFTENKVRMGIHNYRKL